ncbi:helix-turn-helix domain-containing protein [Sphingobacterium sp. SYP-B4668]|uniref:helix-turn-helix domain-containing protein n=1 Tax=Sphingobacterium sp. SYP-B4668 TaxID=2996035 RepID=UPI0022DD309E|nr:helix-turn-helix transcriptional regulator [Sphingobacterium sp. SYP-B4668]
METGEKYVKEYGNQVQRYLDTFEIVEEDLAKLTGTTSNNIKNIINGEVGLNIKKMINIASVFGIPYYHFANPKAPIPSLNKLPKPTQEKIAERQRKGVMVRDGENKFSSKLDSLILGGHFNTPTTSKLTLAVMGEEFKDKNPSEVTSLLNRPPRDEDIKSIGKLGKQHIYIHVDHAEEFEKLSKEALIELIKDKEANLNLAKEKK